MISALLLTAVLAQAAPEATVVRVGERDVPLTYPAAPGPFDAAQASGQGPWRVAIAADGTALGRFLIDGGWADVTAAREAWPVRTDAAEWSVRVFVLTDEEIAQVDETGRISVRPTASNRAELERLYEDLARFQSAVESLSEGRVRVRMQVTEEIGLEWALLTPELAAAPRADEAWLADYASPRVNTAPFEADDGVERGPYDSVFVVRMSKRVGQARMKIGGTPVSLVRPVTDPLGSEPGGLALAMYREWLWQLSERARAHGLPVRELSDRHVLASPRSVVPAQYWPIAADEFGPTDAQLLERASGSWSLPDLPEEPAALQAPVASQPKLGAGAFEVSPAQDSAKGEVLRVEERGFNRAGKVTLLSSPVTPLTPSGSVRFWMRAPRVLPYAVRFTDRFGRVLHVVSLGPEPATPLEVRDLPWTSDAVSFAYDSQWRQVEVPWPSPGAGDVHHVELVAHPNSLASGRPTGVVELFIDDVAVSPEPPAARGSVEPLPLDGEELERQVLINRLASIQGAPTPDQLLALDQAFAVNDSRVRIQAAYALTTTPMPQYLPALITRSRSANVTEAVFCIRAIARINQPDGWEHLRGMILSGPFDHNRREAAAQVGALGDERSAATISTLLAAADWRDRLAAVQALASVPGERAATILVAFLQETNPRVRLEVAQRADVAFEVVNQRLLFAAVNDPSEDVRAVAALRLTDSSFSEFRDQALGAVRDSSLRVRLRVLSGLRAAVPGARNAVLSALSDPRAAMRAKALERLRDFDHAPTAEDLGAVLDDPHPEVREQLRLTAQRFGLTLQGGQ